MYEYNGTVLRVVDGDTYDILIDVGFNIKIKHRFRLLGVDTPETWRPTSVLEKEKGSLVTQIVKELIEEENVTVKTYKTDKYGRYLCNIITKDNISLTEYLKTNNLLKQK